MAKSSHKRVAVEEELHKRQASEGEALKIVMKLMEGQIQPQELQDSADTLNSQYYRDLTEERAITLLCGYPLCGQTLKKSSKPVKYHISIQQNKVYDMTERRNFCSSDCFKASKYFENQLSEEPLWSRVACPPAVQLLQTRSTQIEDDSVIIDKKLLYSDSPVDVDETTDIRDHMSLSSDVGENNSKYPAPRTITLSAPPTRQTVNQSQSSILPENTNQSQSSILPENTNQSQSRTQPVLVTHGRQQIDLTALNEIRIIEHQHNTFQLNTTSQTDLLRTDKLQSTSQTDQSQTGKLQSTSRSDQSQTDELQSTSATDESQTTQPWSIVVSDQSLTDKLQSMTVADQSQSSSLSELSQWANYSAVEGVVMDPVQKAICALTEWISPQSVHYIKSQERTTHTAHVHTTPNTSDNEEQTTQSDNIRDPRVESVIDQRRKIIFRKFSLSLRRLSSHVSEILVLNNCSIEIRRLINTFRMTHTVPSLQLDEWIYVTTICLYLLFRDSEMFDDEINTRIPVTDGPSVNSVIKTFIQSDLYTSVYKTVTHEHLEELD